MWIEKEACFDIRETIAVNINHHLCIIDYLSTFHLIWNRRTHSVLQSVFDAVYNRQIFRIRDDYRRHDDRIRARIHSFVTKRIRVEKSRRLRDERSAVRCYPVNTAIVWYSYPYYAMDMLKWENVLKFFKKTYERSIRAIRAAVRRKRNIAK